jgi:hypothetical protein
MAAIPGGSLTRWSKDPVARGERSAPLLQAEPEARPGARSAEKA